jgi:hypothetical protein
MAGKHLPPREVRLATGAQLYVLNRAGKLRLVLEEELEPVLNGEADAAIKRSMVPAPARQAGAPTRLKRA